MNLKEYIFGNRKGKNAHSIEKQAMTDEFLRDALEGFDLVTQTNDERLRRLSHNVLNKKKKNYTLYYIAASIIIILGLFYFYPNNKHNQDIAVNKEIEHEIKKETAIEKQPETEDAVALNQENREQGNKKSVDIKRAKKAEINEVEAEQTKRQDKEINADSKYSDYYAQEIPGSALPQTDTLGLNNSEFLDKVAVESAKQSVKTEVKNAESISTDAKTKLVQSARKVTGIVTDKNTGEPLPSVAVLEKGSNNSILTDIDGKFELNVSPDSQLEFSYIGYELVTASPKADMTIAMNEDHVTLNDVVIVSYGTGKKESATGSISSINSDMPYEQEYNARPVIGMAKYKKYLENNVQLPADKKCRGKVVVQFKTNKSGEPYSFTVKKSLCDEADNEAIRLIKDGPKWTRDSEVVKITVKFLK